VSHVHRFEHLAVEAEGLFEVGAVPVLELRALELRRDRRAPSPAGRVVVAHVPRRLFEVGGQPTPLQRFGEELRRLLACQVHAAELRHRIVSVLDEHSVVELLGALDTDLRQLATLVDVFGELIEEQPTQRLRGPRIPREKRPLHDLGQVH
jgi:hypothetical protein